MTFSNGAYFIRKGTGKPFPKDYEFFDGESLHHTNDVVWYAKLDGAVSAWERMPADFRETHKEAYIVGPRAGYYTLEGKRKR